MQTLLKALSIAVPILFVAVFVTIVVVFLPSGGASSTAAGGEWTCSMHPQVRQPGPGQCPICGMNLIRVEQLAAVQARDERRGGLEVEPVTFRELFKEVRTVGKLDYNERRVEYITARIAGRVERVYADFPGIHVKKGHHLVDIYSSDLVVAQTVLFQKLEALKKATGDKSYAEDDVAAARTKLRLLGILPEQIAEMERSGKEREHLTIYALLGGTIIEKSVRLGQYVKEGDLLYRIADLDPIWLYLDIYEFDQAWVRSGQTVEVTFEAYPAEKFRGTVVFIDPYLDDKTRSVKVRVNLKNSDRRLKPAMYASASIRVRLRADGSPEPTGIEGKYICPMHPEIIRDTTGKCPECEMPLERVPLSGSPLLNPKPDEHAGHGGPQKTASPPAGKVLAVRATAVLNTGRRAIAYRKRADGAYELVELEIGPRAEGKDDAGQVTGYYPVRKGLQAGDQVVIRGGFLLDSQRQIEGMPSLLYPEGQSAVNLHSGHGGAAPAAPAGGVHKH
jgi:Cu(I)/Ag(I) efflux system membrane fusion protein